MGWVDRLLDFIAFLWPFRIVKQWERAIYYEGGRAVRELGPGLYLFLPWFTSIHEVTVVPDIVQTPRLDITLSDGAMLTFAAEADYVVTDVQAAVNTVHDYHHRVTELLAGVLSESLAEKSASDLAAGVRGRLLATILGRANKEMRAFGVEVKSIWFTTFVLKARTFRLLGDGTVPWA
jgi:regulator of protease activity HflC (stomatin/prohibitin superfamily)